ARARGERRAAAARQPSDSAFDHRAREGDQPLRARDATGRGRVGEQIPGQARERPGQRVRRLAPVEKRVLSLTPLPAWRVTCEAWAEVLPMRLFRLTRRECVGTIAALVNCEQMRIST